jgi:hypothetical protein
MDRLVGGSHLSGAKIRAKVNSRSAQVGHPKPIRLMDMLRTRALLIMLSNSMPRQPRRRAITSRKPPIL